MQVWLLVVVVVGAALMGTALGLTLWRRQRAESGWTEWRRTAAGLPWRDRMRIVWSTTSGRAVADPRLAALAVQRAECSGALIDAVAVRQRRTLRALALLELVVAVLFAVDGSWVQTGIYLAIAVGFACLPFLVRGDRTRARRSAEANRAS